VASFDASQMAVEAAQRGSAGTTTVPFDAFFGQPVNWAMSTGSRQSWRRATAAMVVSNASVSSSPTKIHSASGKLLLASCDDQSMFASVTKRHCAPAPVR